MKPDCNTHLLRLIRTSVQARSDWYPDQPVPDIVAAQVLAATDARLRPRSSSAQRPIRKQHGNRWSDACAASIIRPSSTGSRAGSTCGGLGSCSTSVMLKFVAITEMLDD